MLGSGDNVGFRLDDFRKQGPKFVNLETGEEDIDRISDKIVAATFTSVCLWLRGGKRSGLIITGRASDNAMYVHLWSTNLVGRWMTA